MTKLSKSYFNIRNEPKTKNHIFIRPQTRLLKIKSLYPPPPSISQFPSSNQKAPEIHFSNSFPLSLSLSLSIQISTSEFPKQQVKQ